MWFPYSLNGARFSTGVVPLDCLDCGSTDPFLGVCIPDGVEDPLRLRLCSNSCEEKEREKEKQILNIKLNFVNKKKRSFDNKSKTVKAKYKKQTSKKHYTSSTSCERNGKQTMDDTTNLSLY